MEDQLKQLLETHDAKITELFNQVQTLSSKLATIETDRLTLITALAAATASNEKSSTTTTTHKPKATLPDPEKFAGTPYTWETWYPSIQSKIRIDGPAIGGPEAQFFYVYGRLEPKIQGLVMPQLAQAEDNGVYDPQHIIKQLARLFDDPNKIRQAEEKLQALKMGDSDHLTAFLSRFERLLYTAKANKWPDATKIAILRRALNRSVRTKLDSQILVPSDYEGFVKMLLQLIGAHSGTSWSGTSHGKDGGHGGHKDGGDPMDLSAIASIGMLDLVDSDESHWRGQHKDLPTVADLQTLFEK